MEISWLLDNWISRLITSIGRRGSCCRPTFYRQGGVRSACDLRREFHRIAIAFQTGFFGKIDNLRHTSMINIIYYLLTQSLSRSLSASRSIAALLARCEYMIIICLFRAHILMGWSSPFVIDTLYYIVIRAHAKRERVHVRDHNGEAMLLFVCALISARAACDRTDALRLQFVTSKGLFSIGGLLSFDIPSSHHIESPDLEKVLGFPIFLVLFST